jgi:outer membrane protein
MIHLIKKSILFILFLTIGINKVNSQNFHPLVEKVWKNNQQLHAKHFQLESAGFALSEAKALFGPFLQFGVQYTLAAGGRKIELPVGDLLNPVYSALNTLTQSNNFPAISNANEQFFPNNFYDARFRISQPVYYPDLIINRRLKQETVELKNLEIKAFKRLLSKEIMMAYFNVKAAEEALQIYAASDTLLAEVRRATTSMIKNGVALPSALSRVETQQSILRASAIEAESNWLNARRYVQFLTGEEEVYNIELPLLPSLQPDQYTIREEILQIEQGKKMQMLSIDRENKFYYPKLGVQMDVGSQDFNFGFEPYVLLGLNLEVNLFDNNRHKHRKSGYKAEIMALDHQQSWAEEQIQLQIDIANQNFISAMQQAQTYETRLKTVDRLYTEIFKKYKEGNGSYLDVIDAQTQVTQIKLQYNLARQNAWMKWAEYVYQTASFPIL